MRGVSYGYYISSTSFQFEKYPNQSGIPTFRCSLIYCVISVCVSSLRKICFNAYAPRQISTKNQFLNKPGFPLSALIILDWYPYVSLFPDLLSSIGLSVSGLRKIRFNAYTPRRISTKNQFPNKPGFPLSQVNNFSLVSLRFSVP